MKHLFILLCFFGVVFGGATIFNTSNYCEFLGSYWTDSIKYPHIYGLEKGIFTVSNPSSYFNTNFLLYTFTNTTIIFYLFWKYTKKIDLYYDMSNMPIGNYSFFIDFAMQTDILYNVTKNSSNMYYVSSNGGSTWTGYPVTEKLRIYASDPTYASNNKHPEITVRINFPFNLTYNNKNFSLTEVLLTDGSDKMYPRIFGVSKDGLIATYNSSYYFQTQSTREWDGMRCNMTFLFSSKVLKPEILITPSLYGASFYKPYNPATFVVTAPNSTPFFFKDEYFKQWYYVPAIPCYSTDVITTSVYAINEFDKCYVNDTLVSTSNQYQEFGTRINKIGIIYQNHNISCTYQNTTDPYFIECKMNDTMYIGNGWRMVLKEELNNQSIDYCLNESSSKNVELKCFIDRNKKYTLTVYVNVDNKYYPLKYFLYSGGASYPSLTLGNLTYLLVVIILIAGLLLFPHTPEFTLLSFAFALLFIVYMGLITYFNVFVPVLLIIVLLLLVLYRKF